MHVVIWSNVRRHMPGWPEAFEVLERAGLKVSDAGESPLLERQGDLLASADALLVGTSPITSAIIEHAPRLRVIAKPGVGVDNVDLGVATARGVVVCNTPGVNSDAVADHTLALALAVMRDLVRLDGRVRRGLGWTDWPVTSPQLSGARVGVIGTGNIGQAVIRRLASGFAAKVLAFDLFPRESIQSELGATYVPLDELLAASDLVCVHIPLSDSTRGLIGSRELGLMKPGAFLVNTSRGGIVDEDALVEALSANRIAGAGLDVFETEPCLSSPLFGLERVILTPHVAGFSGDASLQSRIAAAEEIVAALNGTARNPVNSVV